jgi:tRNA (cytidine/uridine-2'-O-)-methyltransferase
MAENGFINVALFEPEIPPNTGNIIRLCANCGANLHLIHPLGFALEDKAMRRAGLDYHEWASIKHYDDFAHFRQEHSNKRIIACTTKTTNLHTDIQYNSDDILLFGPESRGLPQEIRDCCTEKIRIPMRKHSRSINLANAVSIIVYEAWRQMKFTGGI